MYIWKHNLQELLKLFLQSHCPLCQRTTSDNLCEYCTIKVQDCHFENPSYLWQKPLPVFSWGIYGGLLKRAITVMKYANQPQIAYVLGQLLGEAWLLKFPYQSQLIVVPIPLHISKQKKRGYNQAALIAQSFCQRTGLKLQINGLVRSKETQAQHNLSLADREKNLAAAFAIGRVFYHHLPPNPVLLVDDIYTTGATARSAMYTLRQHRIAVYGLATVATTIKKQLPLL
jgi:ComF family protein